MSDFKYNDIDSIANSAAIAKNFSNNLVPANGIEITATTTASRGYAEQTLVSADIISSASGKELLSSSVYTDMFNINMNRESLSTLTKSIFGPSTSLNSLTISEPGSNGSDQPGTSYSGQEAALRLATAGSLGKKYNEGMYEEITSRINENYNSGPNNSDVDPEYIVPPDTVTTTGLPVALFSLLTDQEKNFYKDRGDKLKGLGVVADYSYLTSGFSFDVPDDLTNLRFFGSYFPHVANENYTIPENLIQAKLERAYPSACLIELLILLGSKGYKFKGGLGAHRGSDPKQMGPNNSRLSSGTATDKTVLTDHAFGRGFDIDYFVNSDEKALVLAGSASEYMRQLDIFLAVLNTIPRHLVPDQIGIGNWCSKEYIKTGTSSQVGKLVEKYENLKYTSITMDSPTSSVHKNHIHISFSAYRAGKYAGPGGALTSFDSQSGPKSTIVSAIRQKLEQSNIGLEYQDKSYIKDDSQLTDLQVFELLYSIANLNAEIAAVFTALTYRETRNRPYSANKYGFFGLLQYGTRTKSGGDIEVDLLIPTKEKVKMWELAFKNWRTEEYEKTKVTQKNINSILEKIQDTPNVGKEYYDERAWIPKNQMSILRGKLGQPNIKKQIDNLGNKASRSVFAPWGEGFLTHGWIGGTSFYLAADIYKKATGLEATQLQDWLRRNVPKDSVVWEKDPNYGDRPKLEVWMDLTLYTKAIIASDKKSIYQDIYK